MSVERPENKAAIREIFLKALEMQSPAEREAYLQEACGSEAALRAKVDALLDSTLYGTASSGGSSGNGTVFKVNIDGTAFTTLQRSITNPMAQWRRDDCSHQCQHRRTTVLPVRPVSLCGGRYRQFAIDHVGREECFHRARSRRPRERRQTTILIQQGLAGQLHCLCDGGLADFAAAPPLKYELPGESSLHIGQNIRHEHAGAFESGFTVANCRVSHDISAQLDSRRGSFLCRSHGPNLSCPQPPDKVRVHCKATTLRVSIPTATMLIRED